MSLKIERRLKRLTGLNSPFTVTKIQQQFKLKEIKRREMQISAGVRGESAEDAGNSQQAWYPRLPGH